MKKGTAALVAVTLLSKKVAAQAGFSALPYSFIQPANHSCVLQAKLPSCPEQNPNEVSSFSDKVTAVADLRVE